MSEHEKFMQLALELARRGEGRTRPNPPVGAVVLRDGHVVGRGFHPRAGEPHAEIFALEEAGDMAAGAELYVTLEPCSHHGRTGPCCEAIVKAGIRRVVIGATDPNPHVDGGGIRYLQQAGLEVFSGILEPDCQRLIAPFARHATTGLPFVILKSAMTLDGFTACASGDSRWVSGEESRLHVHGLRDRVDAIMVGAGTVEKDDPRLTTRLPGDGRDPLRVVVDSTLRLSEKAAIFQTDSDAVTLIATTGRADTRKVERLRAGGAEVLILAEDDGWVDLKDLLQHLGRRDVQSLLLEGGATLAGRCFRQRLINRVMIFVAPRLIGGADGRGIFAGPGVQVMNEAPTLQDVRVSRFGDDTLIEGEMDDVYRPD
ncbi:MAG: bifunctional diaminohydroxyphosphoribosylaminopyrimidine deaminase/5-amino-6-(5-phosphoribosylamino)uracil reductase RibD [Desulfuromonadales bacterium]